MTAHVRRPVPSFRLGALNQSRVESGLAIVLSFRVCSACCRLWGIQSAFGVQVRFALGFHKRSFFFGAGGFICSLTQHWWSSTKNKRRHYWVSTHFSNRTWPGMTGFDTIAEDRDRHTMRQMLLAYRLVFLFGVECLDVAPK